jgi:multiple sugar transport system substrate-binding protein
MSALRLLIPAKEGVVMSARPQIPGPCASQAIRRRALLRISVLAGGVLASGLLAACGANGVTTTSAVSSPASASAGAAVSTAATSSVAAVATTSKAAATASASAAPASATVIPVKAGSAVYWMMRSTPAEVDWINKVAVPNFEKSTGGQIKVQPIPSNGGADFDTKLFTLFAADTPADVWAHWGQSGFRDFLYKNMVLELTPLVARDNVDLTAYVKGVADIYKVGGKLYALPFLSIGSYTYYNRDLYKQAGLEPPGAAWDNSTWTWDKAIEDGKKMTRANPPTSSVYATFVTTDVTNLAYLNGADPWTKEHYETGKATTTQLTSAGVVDAVQKAYDATTKEGIYPGQGQKVRAFQDEGVAFYTNGGWETWNNKKLADTGKIKFQWGIAPMPAIKSNKDHQYTDPWMIAVNSKIKDGAWGLVKYLIGKDASSDYINNVSAQPARQDLYDDWAKSLVQTTGMTQQDIITVAQGGLSHGQESVNHLFIDYGPISTALDAAMKDVWTGKIDPKTGLTNADQAIVGILAQIH